MADLLLVKYLLLDYVDLHRHPLNIFSAEAVGLGLNKAHHGLPIDKLAQHLFDLINLNLLEVLESNNKLNKISITLSDITSCLHDKDGQGQWLKGPFIGLTEEGGEVWEKFFCVNWDKYYNLYENESGSRTYVTIEIKEDIQFMWLLVDWASCFCDFEEDGYWSFEERKPWKPRYWKTLERGFIASRLVEYMGLPPHNLRQWFSDTNKWRKEWRELSG